MYALFFLIENSFLIGRKLCTNILGVKNNKYRVKNKFDEFQREMCVCKQNKTVGTKLDAINEKQIFVCYLAKVYYNFINFFHSVENFSQHLLNDYC